MSTVDSFGRPNKLYPALKDMDTLRFGKYSGTKLIDVPAWYLLSLFDLEWVKEKHPELYNYIYNSKQALEKEMRDRNDEE